MDGWKAGNYVALRSATAKQIIALRSAARTQMAKATHCFCGFKLANICRVYAESIGSETNESDLVS